MAGVRRGTFTCVGWQVTLCDPIWQVACRSSEMGFPGTAISAFTFTFFYLCQKFSRRRTIEGEKAPEIGASFMESIYGASFWHVCHEFQLWNERLDGQSHQCLILFANMMLTGTIKRRMLIIYRPGGYSLKSHEKQLSLGMFVASSVRVPALADRSVHFRIIQFFAMPTMATALF